MIKKDQDVILGISIIILSGIFLTQAKRLPAESAMFPKYLLYLMILSGICIILRACSVMKKKGKAYKKLTAKEFLLESGIPGGILLVLCFMLEFLGFYIVSFIIITAISVLQEYISKGTYHIQRKPVFKTLIFAAGSTIFMFICFSTFLSLPTPKGIFGF